MFKQKGLTFSFITSFCLLIAVPILVLSFVFGKLYQDILMNNASESLTQAEINIASALEREIQNASLMVSTIARTNDSEILEQLTGAQRETDATRRYEQTQLLRKTLNYILLPHNKVASLIVFFKDGSTYRYRRAMTQSADAARGEDWYARALETNNRVQVVGIYQDAVAEAAGRYTINMALGVPGTGTANDVEVIWFSYFTDALDAPKGEDAGVMMVVDEAGRIMMSRDKSLEGQNAWDMPHLADAQSLEKGSYQSTLNGEGVLVTTYALESVNWKVINYVPSNYLTRELQPAYAVFIGVIVAVLAFFSLFMLFFFRSILRPVDRLVEGMQRVENGDFSVVIAPAGNRELRRLTASFNQMVQHIERLVHEVMRQEQDRLRVEIEVLQAQINPHFFANALNAIRFMAVVAKFESIQKMTEALIQIFTTSFDKSVRISVRGEMQIIESYVYLMQVRYNGKFEVEYDIAEDVLDDTVPKMLMQPVVENAILHGFNELESLGKLRIEGYRKDKALVFVVCDNGAGLSEERIAGVMQGDAPKSKTGHGIGLANVMERIRLNYAEGSGLQIESVPSQCTKVTVTLIPFEENPPEKHQ